MRIDRASRFIAAPRERVFQAFVEPDAIVRWLPPSGSRGILEEFDPRPNGPFRMTLVFDKGSNSRGKTSDNSDRVTGRFVALACPELIEQQFMFDSNDPHFAGTMTMKWTLSERAGGTLVNVAAINVPEGITPDEHQTGMNSSLANLATYVETAEGRR